MSPSPDPGPAHSLLLTEQRGGVLLVTLNRPAKLNALNHALQVQLTATLKQAAQDRGVRCVILTGAGRGFCAGLDLSDVAGSLSSTGMAGGTAEELNRSRQERNVFAALEALPMPVVGAINGPAYTGGFELALACDLLIAAPEARFGDTHAALAIMPGAGLSQKLSRAIGMPRAMAVSLAGQPLGGADAYRAGLVSHLVPQPELLPLAWKLAQGIAALEPKFAADLKRLMKQGAALPLGAALALEQDAHRQWAQTASLGPIQARTGAVMAGNRSAAAGQADRAGDAAPAAGHPRPISAEGT
jgi:enoyl-CoA hydratase